VGEQIDARRIERHSVRSTALARPQHGAARSLDHGSRETDGGRLEIEVRPPQGQKLTQASAGHDRHVEIGEEVNVGVSDELEESSHLLDRRRVDGRRGRGERATAFVCIRDRSIAGLFLADAERRRMGVSCRPMSCDPTLFRRVAASAVHFLCAWRDRSASCDAPSHALTRSYPWAMRASIPRPPRF
jgi:hypothetical protein